MLTLIPNESLTGIDFIFRELYSGKIEFKSSFDLVECERLSKDLTEIIEELKKEKSNG